MSPQMKAVIHEDHPTPTSAVTWIYSGHLETHLLLGSTRFSRGDEKGSFCRWVLGRRGGTLLLQCTGHGNSHRSWDTGL